MFINREGPTQSSIAKHFLECGYESEMLINLCIWSSHDPKTAMSKKWWSTIHRLGWWENLQEPSMFNGQKPWFPAFFSHWTMIFLGGFPLDKLGNFVPGSTRYSRQVERASTESHCCRGTQMCKKTISKSLVFGYSMKTLVVKNQDQGTTRYQGAIGLATSG